MRQFDTFNPSTKIENDLPFSLIKSPISRAGGTPGWLWNLRPGRLIWIPYHPLASNQPDNAWRLVQS
jgi:hypothetical protein